MAALFSSAAKDALRLLALVGVMALSTGRATFAQAVAARLPHDELTFTGRLSDVTWSPDGAMLALAVDNHIQLYSNTLINISQLDGHTDVINSLSWSPDGQYLASGGDDKTIRIWDMRSGNNFGALVKTLSANDWVSKVQWSPDGTYLASMTLDQSMPPADGVYPWEATSIWNLSTEQVDRVLPSVLRSISLDWKPDSHLLAKADFGGDDGPAVRVWDADTGQLQFSVPIGGEMPIFDVAWNPNGNLLAIASNWLSVLILDANTQQITQGLEGLGGSRTVAWRPDGLQVAAGDQIGNLGIWDIRTSQLLANIVSAHDGLIRQAAWSPSGSSLATISSEDNTLRIWDTSGIVSPTGLPTTTPFPTLTPSAR